jgi:hypothetical protein
MFWSPSPSLYLYPSFFFLGCLERERGTAVGKLAGVRKKGPSVQIDGNMSVRKRDMAHSKLGVEEKHPYPYKQSHHNLLFIK